MATQAATKAGKVTILQALNAAITDAMESDDSIIVLGEDVADKEEGGIVGVTKGLSTRFGDLRVRSTPIAEQSIVGAAIGASLIGFKPIAEIMLMNFTTVAMDMIVNHAAKLRFMSGGQVHVPLVIRTMTGTGFSSGGQHSDYLEAWFAHVAGIKVVCPSSPMDAYGLLRSAIDDPDPVMVIENMPSYWLSGEAPDKGHRVPIGEAHVLAEGTHLTIIAYGRMIQEATPAVIQLAKEGISAELIDLRTVSPWDRETVLASVAKTGRALVVHEAVTPFGVGAEISSVLNEELFGKLKSPVKRLGGAYCPVPFSKPLEEAFAPRTADILAASKALLGA
jgi:pyruvate dehydrogenase E1 component beta subunit